MCIYPSLYLLCLFAMSETGEAMADSDAAMSVGGGGNGAARPPFWRNPSFVGQMGDPYTFNTELAGSWVGGWCGSSLILPLSWLMCGV